MEVMARLSEYLSKTFKLSDLVPIQMFSYVSLLFFRRNFCSLSTLFPSILEEKAEGTALFSKVNFHEIEFSDHQRTELFGLLLTLMNSHAGEDSPHGESAGIFP